MKTLLPEKIDTVEEAKAFLTILYNNGESYHPEDDAHDIIWNTDIQEHPTSKECDKLNDLMRSIYEVAKGTDFDPCEFLLVLDNA